MQIATNISKAAVLREAILKWRQLSCSPNSEDTRTGKRERL